MKFNLTIIERMILESLQYQTQNINQLGENTNIEPSLLNNALQSLITKGLLLLNGREYSLNTRLNQQILNELNDQANLMCEINEVINSCIRKTLNQKSSSFKLKKVNMSEREEKIYQGLKYNLEAFLNSLQKNDHVSQQKIIFWGEGKYEDIKNSILNY